MVDELSWALYAVRLVHGVGIGGLFATFFTSATDLIPVGRRAEGIALFGISGIAAGGIGPLVGEIVLHRGGYALYFPTLAALAFVALLGTLLLGRIGGLRHTATPAETHMRHLIFEPGRLRLWLVVATFGFTIGGFTIFVAPHVEREGLRSVSLFFLSYSASAVVLRAFFSTLPDRIGLRRSLFPSLLALVLTALFLGFDATNRGLVIAGIFGGVGHGFAFPVLGALAVERAPQRERGAVMSVFTSAIDVGFLASGPALGYVARPYGYPAAFLGCGAMAIVGLVIFFARRRVREPVAQPR